MVDRKGRVEMYMHRYIGLKRNEIVKIEVCVNEIVVCNFLDE